MKRKELINLISAICLCAGVLYGCSDGGKSSDTDENQVIETVETTSATEAATAPTTEAPTEAVTQPEIKETNNLTYSIDENGIELIVDGESTQYIPLGYEPDESNIVADDFDFDGYKDIFIPSEEYRGFKGTYYRYIPASKQFEPWDELNKIGRRMGVYNGEQSLILREYSKTGSRYTYYKWNNDVLEEDMLKDVYFSNYEISDYYEYSTYGSRVLVKRELRNWENGELLKTFERDELVYFSIKENGIEVLRDGKVIQTIEGNYAEAYAPLVESSGYYTLEDAIYKMDYDFDGYLDVFIPDDISYDSAGTYYRYDPDSGLLEKWDEMNKIGKEAYASRKNTINVYQSMGSDFCITAYQWDNGTLKPIGYRVRSLDENGETTVTDYTFDENGEKAFSASYEAGEAPNFYE